MIATVALLLLFGWGVKTYIKPPIFLKPIHNLSLLRWLWITTTSNFIQSVIGTCTNVRVVELAKLMLDRFELNG